MNPQPTDYKSVALPIELHQHVESSNVLLSQAVSSQVPLALESLTSVFGMGTGVASLPLSLDSVLKLLSYNCY